MGSSTSAEKGRPVFHPLERLAAVLATAGCTAISVTIWRNVNAHQSVWPLPALYLIEMVLLAAAAALVVLDVVSDRVSVVWAAAGAMGSFSILGRLSVGAFYAPIALIFMVLAIASDIRHRRFRPIHPGACMLAAAAQAAIMLAVA
jgi:hypothetical protein